MSNVDNFGSGDEPVITVEDHFGSGLAVELDKLPHVEAALAELRTSQPKGKTLRIQARPSAAELSIRLIRARKVYLAPGLVGAAFVRMALIGAIGECANKNQFAHESRETEAWRREVDDTADAELVEQYRSGGHGWWVVLR